MKLLVTGGAGFIGSHIADALIEKGHKVVVVDNLYIGKKENVNKRAKFVKMDVQDQRGLARVFQREKFDFVFHQAAQMDVRCSVENPIFDAQVNILGSLNLLENCVKHKVKKFIFASSGGVVYGDAKTIPTPEKYPALPVSPYGVAKLTVEHYLYYYHKTYSLDYVALRYANVYGPRQNSKGEAGVVAIFIDKLLNNQQPIINGSGKQTRDYAYVDDAVRANLLSMKKGVTGAFNIGTGIETNVNQIYCKLVELTGIKKPKKYGPAKQGEQKRSCLDCKLAKKIFAWKPRTGLNEGLKKTIIWFRNV